MRGWGSNKDSPLWPSKCFSRLCLKKKVPEKWLWFSSVWQGTRSRHPCRTFFCSLMNANHQVTSAATPNSKRLPSPLSTDFMTLDSSSKRLAVWFISFFILFFFTFPPLGVRLDYRSCESLEEILKSVRFNLINLQGAELEENVSSWVVYCHIA